MHRALLKPPVCAAVLLSEVGQQCPSQLVAVRGSVSGARWRRPSHTLYASRARRCSSVIAASSVEGFGSVKTEELRDGSIMFRFGEEADDDSTSAAAAAAATAAAPALIASSNMADDEIAAEDTAAAKDGAAAAEPAAIAAEPGEADGSASSATAADSSPEAPAAAAAGGDELAAGSGEKSPSHSVGKSQLKDLKVTELKELCRENDLSGFSKMRKNELVDFLADALPGDYQI